jgi:hypothetical protein
VHVAAKDGAAARAWLAFIASSAAVLRKHGMEPV